VIDRKLGDTRGTAILLHNLGNVAWSQGDLREAKRLLKESLELGRSVGDQEGDALTLANLASLELATDDVTAAKAAIQQALKVARKLRDAETAMYALRPVLPFLRPTAPIIWRRSYLAPRSASARQAESRFPLPKRTSMTGSSYR